jgi:ethanolamine permease
MIVQSVTKPACLIDLYFLGNSSLLFLCRLNFPSVRSFVRSLSPLGLVIVIGGQYFSWNIGLSAGFWEAFFSMVLTGIGYICLVCCLAEMTSTLPFSGGAYGFVRVCIGPFFGYLIGCLEALQNMAYVIAAVIPLGEMLTVVFRTSPKYEPLYWVVFFITALSINIVGGKSFWRFVRVIGFVSLVLLLLYIGASAQYGDFQRYSQSDVSNYHFNGRRFMSYFPYSSWFFIGIEALPLACTDCKQVSCSLFRPFSLDSCSFVLYSPSLKFLMQ